MTYQYRHIRAEFDPPDGLECGYRIYCHGAFNEVCVDHGKVSVGREVAELSNCALKEFARKYIDVNYSRLCSQFTPETVLTRTPLSETALDAAARIQKAANVEIQRIEKDSGTESSIDYSDIAERLRREIFYVQEFCEVILEGVQELPGYQSIDGDDNELRISIDRQQLVNTQQIPQIQMM